MGDITSTQDRIEPPGAAPRPAEERIRAYLELRHRRTLALILLVAAGPPLEQIARRMSERSVEEGRAIVLRW